MYYLRLFQAMEVDTIMYEPFEGQICAVYYSVNREVTSTVGELRYSSMSGASTLEGYVMWINLRSATSLHVHPLYSSAFTFGFIIRCSQKKNALVGWWGIVEIKSRARLLNHRSLWSKC